MELVDVGVWLAAVWGRHVHHRSRLTGFGKETDDIVFCRVTQMGLLRLLSNPTIMVSFIVDHPRMTRLAG